MINASEQVLEPLFSPRSVAVIGASASLGKLGNVAIRSLAGFPGKVFAVNPRSDTAIESEQTVRSVADIGYPVDLALLCVPPEHTPAAIEECVHSGIRAGVIFAGGMAESGDVGVELQRRTVAAAKAGGMRLLGPNTSGYLHPHAGVTMSFAPGVERIVAGPIGIVAQSGGVNLALAWCLDNEGAGVSLAVGLGNAPDVNTVDVLRYLGEHEATKVVLLHLEGVADGRALVEAVAEVTANKPVVVLKVGRSDVADFAASHTGALTGSWSLARSALTQAGAVVVDDTMQMVAAARALAVRRARPRSRPGVGIVTGQAGPALLMTDALRSAGVMVPELSEATVSAVGELLPPITFHRNPVDTARPGATFKDVVRVVAADDAIDILGVCGIYEPTTLDPLTTLAGGDGDDDLPLVFVSGGPEPELSETASALATQSIALFRYPERGAQAIAALAVDARAQARRQARDAMADDDDLATGAASAVFPEGVSALDEATAKDLLGQYGVRTPVRCVCATRAQAHAALASLTKPIVVKILHPDATHKTELGAVHLGVTDAASLDGALDAIDAAGFPELRYLLEEAAASGVELIVGATRDPSFGPTVLLGIGGIAAEALNDVALRLAPLTTADALEMLEELRASDLLYGYRGAAAVDRQELASVLVAVGQLLVGNPAVSEIDINPLRATTDGLIALDALVVS